MGKHIEIVTYQLRTNQGKWYEFECAKDLEQFIWDNFYTCKGGKIEEVFRIYEVYPATYESAEEHQLLREDIEVEYSVDQEFGDLIKQAEIEEIKGAA